MYQHIRAILAQTCGLENESEIVLEKPKNKDLGHLATPLAFSLAKIKRQNPKLLAEELSLSLAQNPAFSKVEALNGFINLTLSTDFLFDVSKAESTAPQSKQNKESILLEFVSANPTGPLHIGHARGAVYGDVLSRVGRHLGYEITAEYYINDAGSQIQMLGLSLLLAGQEHILKREVEYPESYYRGEYIVDLAKECEKHFGKSIFESEDSIPTLADFGKNAMLQEIKDNLSQVGISFDNFVSEKALYERWDSTLQTLKQNNGIYTQDSKVWIASSKLNDEKDRVIVRESGEPTYLAGDIIYHQDKFQRGFERYINIWGADHHGYIQRVKAAIHFLGYDENKLEVLLSQMVSLLKGGQPYKMSKRAGNFILMKDVASEIGSDALRFIFLSKKPDTHLEFDVDELKKQDSSNPIYYINYANARIHTLFEKAGVNMQDLEKNIQSLSFDSSSRDSATHLLFESLCLSHILESSFRDREMQKICEYLKNLAASLHSFYNTHKILQTPNQNDILYVLKVVSQTLTRGLALLGITAKTRM